LRNKDSKPTISEKKLLPNFNIPLLSVRKKTVSSKISRALFKSFLKNSPPKPKLGALKAHFSDTSWKTLKNNFPKKMSNLI
jgi:hypothetical protein